MWVYMFAHRALSFYGTNACICLLLWVHMYHQVCIYKQLWKRWKLHLYIWMYTNSYVESCSSFILTYLYFYFIKHIPACMQSPEIEYKLHIFLFLHGFPPPPSHRLFLDLPQKTQAACRGHRSWKRDNSQNKKYIHTHTHIYMYIHIYIYMHK